MPTYQDLRARSLLPFQLVNWGLSARSCGRTRSVPHFGDKCGADEDGRVCDRIQFDSAGRQFSTTVMDASVDASLMIKKRPSGEMSQLVGPVRIPVSTMSVWNNA